MYRKMYYTLFNAITDALELMEQGEVEKAKRLLEEAQQASEELYMEGEGEEEGKEEKE